VTSKARIHYINNDLLYCNGCYAGYCDYMLPLCYPSHTWNKYNPIKPIGYPPKVIPPIEPPIENSTRLVYDNYYGAGYVQGKENAIADRHRNYTAPDDICPHPDPHYASYCKGYHVAYDFNWNDIIPGSSPLQHNRYHYACDLNIHPIEFTVKRSAKMLSRYSAEKLLKIGH
jgi:hypothetical protein